MLVKKGKYFVRQRGKDVVEYPDQKHVPKVTRNSIIKYVHDARGHAGVAATAELIQISWQWKGCIRNMEGYIRKCHNYQLCASREGHLAEQQLRPTHPLLYAE